MATVYLSAKLPEVASRMLDQAGIDYEVFAGDGLITKDELLKHVTNCQVLITPLSTQVDKDVIDAAPNLKLIANFGAGFNNIDTAYARTKGIDQHPICFLNGDRGSGFRIGNCFDAADR